MKVRKTFSVVLVALLLLTVLMSSFSVNAAPASSAVKDIKNTLVWQQGGISDSGAESSTANTIRTDYFKVDIYSKLGLHTPNQTFYHNIYWYDKNKTFVDKATASSAQSNALDSVYTVQSNYAYARITFYKSAGLTPNFGSANVTSLNATPIVSTNQIDANKTGTLKIYKYEMEDTSVASTNGLGYDSEKDNVPSGATPLDGVTFEIKRVVAIDTTGIYYYDSSGTKHDYTIYSGTGFTDQTLAQMVAAFKTYKPLNDTGGTTSVPTRTQKTTLVGSDHGVAQFTNLPLGIYLVQEKSSPAQVTKKVDDFVVSIPRMSTDRMTWLYSTSVFPKNETVYKSVKIEKRDGSVSGNPLITASNASFSLAKSENNSTFTDIGTLTTSNGVVTKTNLPVNCYYRLTETTAPTGYIKDTAGSNNITYFYLAADGKILSRNKSTTISSPSGTTPAVLSIKNYRPRIEKYIDASRGNGSSLKSCDSLKRYSDSNNFQYYMLKIFLPEVTSNLSTLSTFQVLDTFTNVDGTKGAPVVYKVTRGANTSAANSNVVSTDAYTYTCTQNSTTNTTYDTTLTFDTSKLVKGNYYYIYYKCFVRAATTNYARLKYSLTTTSTDTSTNTINSNSVRFITGSFCLKKVNESRNALAGAEFQIYNTQADAVAGKNPVYASTSSGGATQTYTFTSNSSGIVYIYDVDIGSSTTTSDDSFSPSKTYWLAETKAPTGYTLLAEPVEIMISKNGASSSNLEVVNTKQIVFPLTGSIGIGIFIVVGILMLSAAVAVLLIKRKKAQIKKGEIK